MSEIAILVPVLGRPQRAAEVFESALVASAEPHRMIFLCSPGDHDEINACYETDAQVEVVDWEAGRGDWARKINYGLTLTDEPYVLLGADDLLFHDGWDIAALRVAEKGFGVIGTNDLGNATVMRGEHSTHPLCARAYAETWGTVDEPEKLLHEGYQHQWVDTELVQTAKVRGQWAFAADSIVEHLHPLWPDGKGGHKGVMDDTYRKALSTPREDHRLYSQRKRLWELQARAARQLRP